MRKKIEFYRDKHLDKKVYCNIHIIILPCITVLKKILDN